MGIEQSTTEPINDYEMKDKESISLSNYKIGTDNSVTFHFKHYHNDYKTIEQAMTCFKSSLKGETPNDLITIEIKLNELSPLVLDLSLSKSLSDLFLHSHSDLFIFYQTIEKIVNNLRIIYENSHNYLIKKLNNDITGTAFQEIQAETKTFSEVTKIHSLFHKFKYETNIIDLILKELYVNCNNGDNDKLQNSFEKNVDKLSIKFSFKDFSQYKSLANSMIQLKMTYDTKNYLLDKFIDVLNSISNIYNKILINTDIKSKDYHEVISELNDYYDIIIKHRLIRHVEVKLKDIQKSINELN